MGDSFYEYLIKLWILGNKKPEFARYKKMYDDTIKIVVQKMVQVSTPSHLTYIAELKDDSLVHSFQHLGCFAGGMFGLGAEGSLYDEHMDIAKGILN
jgi:hypothetical protein